MRETALPPLVGFYILMASVALVALWASDTFGVIVPGVTNLGDWGIGLGCGLGAGLAMVVFSRALTALAEWAKVLAGEFRNHLGDMSHRQVVIGALLSGVGEELLFRGVLQPALGLWLATAVFGVLHVGPNRRFLPWTAMAFGAGFVFGLLFEWTGFLLAPMLAHVVVNYLNLRFLTQGSAAREIPVGKLLTAR